MRTPIRRLRPLPRLVAALIAIAVVNACSSTTDLGATDSTATKLPNDTAKVTFVGMFLDQTVNHCTTSSTITWEVVVDSAKVGDVLVAHITGPSSPGAVRTTLQADSQDVVTKFQVPAGPGVWVGTVDSVGGKPPRSLGHQASAQASVSCG